MLGGCWELMGKVVGVVWRWWSRVENGEERVSGVGGKTWYKGMGLVVVGEGFVVVTVGNGVTGGVGAGFVVMCLVVDLIMKGLVTVYISFGDGGGGGGGKGFMVVTVGMGLVVPVPSKDMEVNMTSRGSDDALVCCIENMIEAQIIDSGASFHASHFKEELERFTIRFSKGCLVHEKTLDIAGLGVIVFKTLFGSLVVARENKRGSLYMVKVHSNGINTIIDGKGSAALWHQRVGHMSEKGMKILALKGNILDLRKADIGFYEPRIIISTRNRFIGETKDGLLYAGDFDGVTKVTGLVTLNSQRQMEIL
nr:hypothetical protein [Tanacetum cinerariifolium]